LGRVADPGGDAVVAAGAQRGVEQRRDPFEGEGELGGQARWGDQVEDEPVEVGAEGGGRCDGADDAVAGAVFFVELMAGAAPGALRVTDETRRELDLEVAGFAAGRGGPRLPWFEHGAEVEAGGEGVGDRAGLGVEGAVGIGEPAVPAGEAEQGRLRGNDQRVAGGGRGRGAAAGDGHLVGEGAFCRGRGDLDGDADRGLEVPAFLVADGEPGAAGDRG
jgi:hypothetical protein